MLSEIIFLLFSTGEKMIFQSQFPLTDWKNAWVLVKLPTKTSHLTSSESVAQPALNSKCTFRKDPKINHNSFRYVESDEPTWRGYLFIIALVLVTIVNTIINAQALFMQYGIGLKIKTSLISAIYRKSLKLSSVGRKEMTGGKVYLLFLFLKM